MLLFFCDQEAEALYLLSTHYVILDKAYMSRIQDFHLMKKNGLWLHFISIVTLDILLTNIRVLVDCQLNIC